MTPGPQLKGWFQGELWTSCKSIDNIVPIIYGKNLSVNTYAYVYVTHPR